MSSDNEQAAFTCGCFSAVGLLALIFVGFWFVRGCSSDSREERLREDVEHYKGETQRWRRMYYEREEKEQRK